MAYLFLRVSYRKIYWSSSTITVTQCYQSKISTFFQLHKVMISFDSHKNTDLFPSQNGVSISVIYYLSKLLLT